jgi:hypothetical protein
LADESVERKSTSATKYLYKDPHSEADDDHPSLPDQARIESIRKHCPEEESKLERILEEDEVDEHNENTRPPEPKQVITGLHGLHYNGVAVVLGLLEIIIHVVQSGHAELLHSSSDLDGQIQNDVLQLRSHYQHQDCRDECYPEVSVPAVYIQE